jgi:hypothetical protein
VRRRLPLPRRLHCRLLPPAGAEHQVHAAVAGVQQGGVQAQLLADVQVGGSCQQVL